MKEKAKLEEEKKDEEKEDPKGIPEFWLTVFKNVDLLSDMLQVRSFRLMAEVQQNWVTECSNKGKTLLPPAGQILHRRMKVMTAMRAVNPNTAPVSPH